jgi:hypothetical protein
VEGSHEAAAQVRSTSRAYVLVWKPSFFVAAADASSVTLPVRGGVALRRCRDGAGRSEEVGVAGQRGGEHAACRLVSTPSARLLPRRPSVQLLCGFCAAYVQLLCRLCAVSVLPSSHPHAPCTHCLLLRPALPDVPRAAACMQARLTALCP